MTRSMLYVRWDQRVYDDDDEGALEWVEVLPKNYGKDGKDGWEVVEARNTAADEEEEDWDIMDEDGEDGGLAAAMAEGGDGGGGSAAADGDGDASLSDSSEDGDEAPWRRLSEFDAATLFGPGYDFDDLTYGGPLPQVTRPGYASRHGRGRRSLAHEEESGDDDSLFDEQEGELHHYAARLAGGP